MSSKDYYKLIPETATQHNVAMLMGVSRRPPRLTVTSNKEAINSNPAHGARPCTGNLKQIPAAALPQRTFNKSLYRQTGMQRSSNAYGEINYAHNKYWRNLS